MARHLFAHSFIHYLLNVYHVLGAVLNFIIVLYLQKDCTENSQITHTQFVLPLTSYATLVHLS